jgi:hypothetical protein
MLIIFDFRAKTVTTFRNEKKLFKLTERKHRYEGEI